MSTKSNSMYVHVLLDRSGSMLARKGPTVAAYNSYIDGLPDDAVISLSTFSIGDLKHPRTNVGKARAKFTADEYDCIGGTALLDGIGTVIQMIDSAAKEFDRVTLVILTDGQELNSREFTRDQIKQLLTDKQEGEGWLVVFLGATADAFAQAPAMGFVGANTMQYDGASIGATANMGNALRRSTMAYAAAPTRVAGRAKSTFTSGERDKAK